MRGKKISNKYLTCKIGNADLGKDLKYIKTSYHYVLRLTSYVRRWIEFSTWRLTVQNCVKITKKCEERKEINEILTI